MTELKHIEARWTMDAVGCGTERVNKCSQQLEKNESERL